MVSGEWADSDRARSSFRIMRRPGLFSARVCVPTPLISTRGCTGKHINPYLGGVPLGRLSTPMIRECERSYFAAACRSQWQPRHTGCSARCRLMARGDQQDTNGREPGRTYPLTLRFVVERVTGIEPALSAWESDRSGPLTALSWASDTPLVTAMNPATPGLMARQWPNS